MKNSITSLLLGTYLFIGLISCNSNSKYDIATYYEQEAQDTILTNIVTYIYKVPRGVPKERKHYNEYRHLYVKIIKDFEFLNYYIDPSDSTHYFYMIRPARNAHGHKRGVGGKYKVDQDFNLLDFEEIFNTPMMSVEEIKEKGTYLWDDLMYYKNVDRYFLNKSFIEFPDERVRYDKETKEWTYEKLE